MERPRRPGPLGPRTLPTKRNSSSASALSRAGSTRSVGSLNLDAIPVRRSLDEEVQSGEEMTTAPTTEANLTTTTTTTTETSLNPPNQDPEHSSPPPPPLSLQNSPLVLEDPQPLSPTKTRREEVEASQSFVLPEEPEEEEEEEEEEMPHRESLPPPPPSKSPPPLYAHNPSLTQLRFIHALRSNLSLFHTYPSNFADIVSRAIRLSARESFVRLLSLKLLDTILPDELEKLAEKRRGVGGRYRFTVQRRSMLMQGLWAVVASPDLSSANTPTSSITPAATSLLTQLSDASAECDRMAEDLVKICDQVKEIHQLVDGHWASALAVALRKLNSSYAKRTAEVLTARDRIHQLEAERDDAWKEAESVAKNLGTMEAEFKRVSAELVKLTGVQDELKKAEEEIVRLEDEVRRLSDVEEEVRDLRERVKNVKVKARSRSQSRNAEALMEGVEGWDWDMNYEISPKKSPKKAKLSATGPKGSKAVPYFKETCTRCTVETVAEADTNGRPSKQLVVRVVPTGERRSVALSNEWASTDVRPGDIVNILGEFVSLPQSSSSPTSSIVISSKQNVLVLHPDILVTATALSTAAHCRRKALISGLIRSSTDITPSLVWGHMLHT
ncbi:DNA replication endonuclease-helicase Dna2, partial [Marasmius crinis-equi]